MWQVTDEQEVWSFKGPMREGWKRLFEAFPEAVGWIKDNELMDQGDLSALYGWAVLGLDEVVWDRQVPWPTNEENAAASIELLAEYLIPKKGSVSWHWAIIWDKDEEKLSVCLANACELAFPL